MTIEDLKNLQCSPHNELVMEIQRLKERLKSAEDVLRKYCDLKIQAIDPQEGPGYISVAKIAHEHFKKYPPQEEG